MTKLCVFASFGRQLEDITEYVEQNGVFNIFGEAERERIAGISSPSAKALSLGGLIALKQLTDFCTVEEKGLEISRAEGGKPYFSGNNNCSFSISHSGELSVAVLTINGSDIGVDIEAVDRERDVRKISDRFFTPEEREELACSNFDKRTFYRLWTTKEARAKRVGEGLSRFLVRCGESDDGEYLLHYSVIYNGHEYIMTVCTSHREIVEIIRSDTDVDICKINESVKK